VSFTVYPAIDVSGGRAVRLHRGERSRMRVVSDDPVALAGRLAAAGAPFLHLVDLDAAFGDSGNSTVIERILAEASCPVQVGGGVRSEARARQLWQGGAARVVVGTAAVRTPELLERLLEHDPDAVVVAADARAGRVVISGWTEDTGEALRDFGVRMRRTGVRHLLVTAVDRDGTGTGPDHAVLSQAVDVFGFGVIASGGIGSIAHLSALEPLAARGLAGAVVGSLLVDGQATVGQLLAATEEW
jgi:phosphoribosylformimino-5-aminoimidazole carboxamide ribotide isomerase